ncbi:MAG: TIGR00341 family protein [Gloeomargarita sp. HHBFW_bins_162]
MSPRKRWYRRFWDIAVMQPTTPQNLAELEKLQKIQQDLCVESQLDTPYLVLVVGSCVIATLGLLSNSAAVIIGAMIVAPLMMPIRGLAFAALIGDVSLFRRALLSVVVGTVVAIILSCLLGIIAGLSVFGSEILARSTPNLLDLGIAVAAGGVCGYALVEPKVSSTLAGTAIAVALMPPVCVVGLGLSQGNLTLSWGAFLLFLTNFLGIALACMVAFVLAGYAQWTKARRVLAVATALTSVLVIPLGISFVELTRQNRLEANLRQALLSGTITFQRVELIRARTHWYTNPPETRLTVRAQEPITPRQVKLLEQFLQRRMGQKFKLIFDVNPIMEVRSNDAESQ